VNRSLLAVCAALAAWTGPARASVSNAQEDLWRQPFSAAQYGGGALYGQYDVFRPFMNPALLSRQPSTWSAGLADGVTFGGDQNAWALAGGYVSPRVDGSAYGFALIASGFSIASFNELDVAGNSTGVTVAPAAQRIGLAAVYEWSFFSLGAAIHGGRVTYGSLPVAYTTNALNADGSFGVFNLSIGTVVSLGHVDLGAQWNLESSGSLGLGGAFHLTGPVKGEIGLDFYLPFKENGSSGGSNGGSPSTMARPGSLEFGMTWHAMSLLDVRAGMLGSVSGGDSTDLRAGVGVPWKSYAFDYAFMLPTSLPGTGATHLLSVTWHGGAARPMAESPQFFTAQAGQTLAVAAFDAQGVSSTDAAIISDMLRNRLIKEGAFNIVEKANMDKILSEQAFQQTGCTSAECAVKLGKVLNVKYLVVGSFGKLLDRYVVSMRVVEVETAKGVYSDEASATDVPQVQEAVGKLAANLTEAVKNAK